MKRQYNKSKNTVWKEMTALLLSFIQNLLNHPNVDEATGLIKEQAQLIYYKFNKREMKSLEYETQQLERTVNRSQRILNKLENKVERIKRWIKVGGEFTHSNFFTVFYKMSPVHQMNFVVAGFFLCVMLVTGTTNVFSISMGSGNPVFIETPIFAWLISMLFPAGTFTLKYFRESLESELIKQTFTQVVYACAFFSILFWGHQFSINFPGLSGGVDLDAMLESAGTGPMMVKAQLLAEFMVSLSLYFYLTDIFYLYLPDSKTKSPELLQCEKDLMEYAQIHNKLLQDMNEKQSLLEQLRDDCQAFVNLAVAKFLSLRIQQSNASLKKSLNEI